MKLISKEVSRAEPEYMNIHPPPISVLATALLPRPLSGIIVGVVYNPPDTSAQEESELVSYIIHTLDQVCTAHPRLWHCHLMRL